jgi:D-alanine-D-alanine ligase
MTTPENIQASVGMGQGLMASEKVAVLMGGSSMEREISLMSGNGVLLALRSRGVNAHPFDPSQSPLQELVEQGFTRAFISLHGRLGEDGTVQGALEVLGIPYTGSGVMASALAMDKVMTKRVWNAMGLRTPESVVLGEAELALLQPQSTEDPPSLKDRLVQVAQQLGYPLIVKPPHEGSSIGVSRVNNLVEFERAVVLAQKYDDQVLCEQFIEGLELTCPLVGVGQEAIALPVVKIEAPQGDYDFENKYFTDAVKYACPSGLPEEVEKEVQALSLAAYQALGCRGWGRADLMWCTKRRLPFLLEMNTSPGMTSHSLVPMSAKASGMSYEDLCLKILSLAQLGTQAKKWTQGELSDGLDMGEGA